MTYSINIGKKQVWNVSNSTREIFNIISNKLESGKEGSKFKYIHLLNNEGTIPYKKANSILEDIVKVNRWLNLVKCPVASYCIKDMELGYAHGTDELIGSLKKGIGIDEEGLFVKESTIKNISSVDDISKDNLDKFIQERYHSKKHFKELKKEDKYFDDFLELGSWHIHYSKLALNKVDKIEHTFKSAGMIWINILKKLEEFVERAKKQKKSMKIY